MKEYENFVIYLSDRSNIRPYDIGANAANDGLCIQSILKMNSFLVQFCLENLYCQNNSLMQDVLDAISGYISLYIEGFTSAQKQDTIRQQMEMRQALSTAFNEQREELFISNYSIKSAINGILLTNLEGNVIYVNPSFINIWKYDNADEVLKIGKISDVAGKEVGDIFASLVNVKSWRGEIQLARKDGTKFDVEMSASQIVDDLGNILGTVASFADITERKKIELQFRMSQKMNALGQLAAGITHDFNNMFSVVKGYLQLLLLEAEEGSQQFQDVYQIKIAMDRCASLTKQLQYFARGVVGEINPVNLNSIIKETYELLTHSFPPGIDIVLFLTDEIWTLEADPSQLSHVIINFCVNARDAITAKMGLTSCEEATENYKGVITIKTRNITLDGVSESRYLEVAPGKYVYLSISDNDIGMSSEVLDRLFEPFYTTKGSHKNTGLGLSIIYGIVEKLKGHIEVQSESGQGTTFEVYLPTSDACVVECEKEKISPSSTLKENTVLIIDDETQLLEITSRFLKQNGYEVFTAENGEKAVSIYREAKDIIGLVVLDVVMPDMGGEACFREIRKINPNAKVLLITGFTNDDSSYYEIKGDVVGIVEKPFDLYKLTETIRNALQTQSE